MLLVALMGAAACVFDLPAAARQSEDRVLTAVPSTEHQSVRADGEAVYQANCASCHQSDGKGTSNIFPPLDGSKWVTGDKERLIRIILDGMTGPLEVRGIDYNASMPPWKNLLNDQEIADVASFIRSSWGNDASSVTENEVRHARDASAGRTAPWTADELQGGGGLTESAPELVDKESAEAAAETAGAQTEAEEGGEYDRGREDVEGDAGAPGADRAPQPSEPDDTHLHFEKVVLVADVTRPNVLEVAPDGRVFFAEREGAVRVWSPEADTTTMVGFIPVNAVHTSGLLGMALDPDFQENGWMYFYYSPHDERKNVLARFTLENGRLIPQSRKVLLEVAVQRQVDGGHSAGEVEFGPDGLLYLSTGDNTSPRATRYAPIDERPGREIWDAQRSAGNTMDLRGKIIRIRPLPDGSYDIPEGNLFPYGTRGRPEIYVMGTRNPFRFTVDPGTGWLYWGDVGPDAGDPLEGRGPAGYDEVNRAQEAGNYGFPYFIGDNEAYNDYDFETEESGPPFDVTTPVNDSPNNYGARILPPARPALIWYPYSESDSFPSLGSGGRSAMAGPVYRYDENSVTPHSLPESYDGVFFIHDFMREWIKRVTFGNGGMKIEPFLSAMTFERPIDTEMGPDGRLYVIEWGSSYEGWYNDDAQIVRLDYYESEERPPAAAAAVSPSSGSAPLDVRLRADASRSRADNPALEFAWDFDGDGTTDARGSSPTVSHTYTKTGTYAARLTVTDEGGQRDADEVEIVVGNTAPSVSIEWPVHGGFFDFGRPIDYRVEVSDPDETVAAERIVVQPHLLHDTHTHDLRAASGFTGTFELLPDETHLYLERRQVVLEAGYTDRGSGAAPALTSRARVILQPRRKQAERAASDSEIERSFVGSLRWRRAVQGFVAVEDGSYFSFDPVNLLGIDSLTFRVAPMSGGTVELRLDKHDGRLLNRFRVDPSTRNLELQRAQEQDEDDDDLVAQDAKEWRNAGVSISDPGGPHELFFVFRGAEEGELMTVDWIEFDGPGIMTRSPDRADAVETSGLGAGYGSTKR